MKRTVLLLFFLLLLFFTQNSFAQEEKKHKSMDTLSLELSFNANDNTVRIQNAPKNSSLEIYDILGVKITSVKIDSNDKTVNLEVPKGCYILKIGEIARKIAIK